MRKVLSFVLVLTLVLSSFSMAFAADKTAAGLTDVAGNANADAIQVAYDLDIVTGNPDGTFLPEKDVTRAEFAAMLTRALAIPDSALAGYATTSFKDTAGYTWAVPYLGFCQSKGIMLGDGVGNVMPGRTITVNEAMTMALRAIGYTANSSMLVGAWPANYVSIAQNEDLYDDVAAATTVNKANAAQIIYNLLTVQKVAVNTDGETVFQQDSEKEAYNLLNTNLGCEQHKKITLGVDYTYDNSVINITGRIGAYGTAYTNDDDDLVAFIPDSTALTGKIDDGKFKVGDTKYDLPDEATISAVFVNTDTQTDSLTGNVDDSIEAFAKSKADGGKNVTIYTDLSGKKIKEVYSVVAWKAENYKLAESDVQDDIADLELLGEDFADDDDGNIDLKAFELVGVASLDDIAKDDVVYVYVDDDDNIRKVAVGTETVEGVIDEIEMKDAPDDKVIDNVTIDGKEYSIAPSELATTDAKTLDVDSEGIFYLDADGKIFDFEGTSGKADTYAVIKAAYRDSDSYDEGKIKLYLSDDSTKTLYLEDKLNKIDVMRTSSVSSIAEDKVADALKTTGCVIGYSLNSDGDIDALNVTTTMGDIYVQSSKVLKFKNKYYDIDPKAAVFTYSGTTATKSALTTGDYDVATLADMKKDETSFGSFILNDDGDVAAIILNEEFVDSKSDDVYAVVNKMTSTKDEDDDPIYKLTGFIDGNSFTKKTEKDDSKYKVAGQFSVYAIAVDGSDIITDIRDLSDNKTSIKDADDKHLYYEGEAVKKKQAGYLTQSGTDALSLIVKDVDDNVITDKNDLKWTVDDKAVVYKWDKNDKEFEKSNLNKIDKADRVSLFDTKDKDDVDGIATVVIYEEIDD